MTETEQHLHAKLSDRRWRLSNLYWVEDESGVKRKFRPNWAQLAFLDAMHDLNVILKARQLGMSTLMAIYALDLCLFRKNTTAGVVDKTDADAVKKLKKILFAYENLDCQDACDGISTVALGASLKADIDIVRSNDHEIEFSNSSQVWAGTSLRGGTIQFLHISELGYIAVNFPKRAEEIRSGSLNTVHAGSAIVIESTHEGGKTGLNYEMIVTAQESPADLSPMDWAFHFFPWWRDPKYAMENARPVTDSRMLAYFEVLRTEHGINLTEGQRAWYAAKERTQKTAMKKEFPSTPEEAVNAVVKGSIYGEGISRARADGRVCDFNPEPGMPIYCAWDIGMSDFADLWFVQPVGLQHRVLDFYENNGEGASHYVEVIRAWERKHGVGVAWNLLPHDAGHREFGTGMSVVQQIDGMGMRNCMVVPRTPDIWVGINKLREMLPNMAFHKTHCGSDRLKDGRRYPSGLGALEAYRTRDESSSTVIKEMPVHDDASHAADGLRTYAEAYAAGMVSPNMSGGSKSHSPRVTVSRGVREISDDDDLNDDPKVRVSYGGGHNYRKIRVTK